MSEYITLTRFRVNARPKKLSPYRKVDGEFVTNDKPIRVRRVKGMPMAISLIPKNGYAALLTTEEMVFVSNLAKRRGWELTRKNADLKVKRYKHLDGDLDCNENLLDALEAVGKRLTKKHGRKVVIFVRSGGREIAEQWVLYRKYGSPRAAYPNENAPHIRKVAADCGIDGIDLADFPGAIEACRAEGVGFPVPGEDWHAELTDNMIGAGS